MISARLLYLALRLGPARKTVAEIALICPLISTQEASSLVGALHDFSTNEKEILIIAKYANDFLADEL